MKWFLGAIMVYLLLCVAGITADLVRLQDKIELLQKENASLVQEVNYFYGTKVLIHLPVVKPLKHRIPVRSKQTLTASNQVNWDKVERALIKM